MRLELLCIISKRGMLLFFLVLLVISIISSFTFSTYMGMYETSLSIVGEDDGIMVVYDGGAKTPVTSLIPLALRENLLEAGAEVISPEVFVPVFINGEAAVVRGIDPASFYFLEEIDIIRGRRLFPNDTTSVIVGQHIADRLGLDLGDRILVFSALADRLAELKVVGIFRSGSSLENEVLTPLWIAQSLRGLRYEYVSMIRVRFDEESKPQQYYDEGFGEGGGMGLERSILDILKYTIAPQDLRRISIGSPSEGMRETLTRLAGLSDITVWSIFFLVIGSTVLLIYYSSHILVDSSIRNVFIARAIGCSTHEVRNVFMLTSFLASILSTPGIIIGFIMADVMASNGLLLVASYTIIPSFGFTIFIVLTFFLTLTSVFSTLYSLSTKIDSSQFLR